MTENNSKNEEINDDQEVEKQLDTLWENLASRRSCEKTHTPEYIKQKDEK